MNITTSSTIKAPIDKVWDFIKNPKNIAECSPDISEFEFKTKTTFTMKVKPHFSFIQGSMALSCKITHLEDYKETIEVTGKGIGSSLNMTINVEAKAKGKNTFLSGSADCAFGGLLKPIPESILQAAAGKVINQLLECVEQKCKT